MAVGVVKSCAKTLGKKGGLASAKRTKAQRSASAKKAAATRKRNARKKTTKRKK